MKRYMTFYLRYQGKICAVGNPHGVTEEEIKELKALYPENQKYEYTYYVDDALSDKKILCRVTTSEAAEYIKNRKRKTANEDNSYESS